MSQYLGVFLDEAREQLELLETHILQMERGDQSSEMLQVLFRAAHTIKGSSRAMGFTAVGDLTHQMENVLDDLRNERQQVTTVTVDVLLRCLDTLTSLIDEVASSSSISTNLEQEVAVLVTQLNALGSSGGTVPESNAGESVVSAEEVPAAPADVVMEITEYEQNAINDAAGVGLNVFRIGIEIHSECLMKSVRVYMVLGALEPLGTVLVANPREEQLDAEEFEQTFSLIFATESDREPVYAALNGISEIEKVTVDPWSTPSSTAETVEVKVAEDPATVSPPPGASAPNAELAEITDNLLKGMNATPETPKAVPPTPEPAKPAAASKPASATNTTGVAHNQTIRVDVARLDNLLNLIGEMVIDRTQIARIGTDLRDRYSQDELVGHLLEATHRIARITSELQDEIMKARMLPIDGVFQRMPRMIRDLAQKTGKEVNFQMFGGETELDRSVLEVLGDPLIHLLRNSVDHGIEPPDARVAAGKAMAGSVRMAARHEENHIVIEITDDGRGMDPNKIKTAAIAKGMISQAQADAMTDRDAIMLIFASGFSTAATLSDISGRGVGMDIVKSNIEKLGGRILVDSKIGEGTRFTIHLPLTLAIVRALLVSAGGGTYVLPLSSVEEMLKLGTDSGELKRHTVGGQATIVLRGQTVPLANLADVLCGDPNATSIHRIPENAYVVVIGYGEKRVGLCVDSLAGEQEVVIKSLGTLLGDISGLAGATILGDGRVALIIDIARAVESINDMGAAAGSYWTSDLGAAA
jgi:two-component system chemotaxis sensor kinase CheA